MCENIYGKLVIDVDSYLMSIKQDWVFSGDWLILHSEGMFEPLIPENTGHFSFFMSSVHHRDGYMGQKVTSGDYFSAHPSSFN